MIAAGQLGNPVTAALACKENEPVCGRLAGPITFRGSNLLYGSPVRGHCVINFDALSCGGQLHRIDRRRPNIRTSTNKYEGPDYDRDYKELTHHTTSPAAP